MTDNRHHILEKVNELFMQYGIKSMTMDDIARHLHMSKKTLYKYVKDKKELVVATIKCDCEQRCGDINTIRERGLNAIDESFEVSKYVVNMLKDIHPSIHYDLEKYHPEAWAVFAEHEKGFIYECVQDNLERGIEEGLYRSDLNTAIVARIYVNRIDLTFDGEVFPRKEFNFSEVYEEMFRYHIRGIASPKGLEYLEKKFDEDGFE